MLLIGFAGSLELNRSPGLDEATGEESMSDDPDFPKANHALQVLRQARLSRKEAAANGWESHQSTTRLSLRAA